MMRVPRDLEPLLDDLSASFRRPQIARRFIFFAAAGIVTGDRTVSAVLRLISLVEPVNPSTFHRLFSHRRWSSDMYGGRWNIEITFQELREHFGLESTRGWSKKTVLRMAPCLFLLYSLVVLFCDTMPASSPHRRRRNWIGKEVTTLSDMVISVRRYL